MIYITTVYICTHLKEHNPLLKTRSSFKSKKTNKKHPRDIYYIYGKRKKGKHNIWLFNKMKYKDPQNFEICESKDKLDTFSQWL